MNAIQFVENYTQITQTEKDIIIQAKSTMLLNNNEPWQKADTPDLFDVTMGSYDGVETCELVGIYILSKLSTIIPTENVGLYRKDCLAKINKPSRIAECIKKKL